MADNKDGIDIKSPITKMFFGKWKGYRIWTIHISTLGWIVDNMNVTERTKETIKAALEMANNRGKFAVLRKSETEQYYTALVSIKNTKNEAEAACKSTAGYTDFVYPIVEPTDNPKGLAQ